MQSTWSFRVTRNDTTWQFSPPNVTWSALKLPLETLNVIKQIAYLVEVILARTTFLRCWILVVRGSHAKDARQDVVLESEVFALGELSPKESVRLQNHVGV